MSETGGIVAALVAFQSELPKIGKVSQAQYGAYADLADVSSILLPALALHGIAYTAHLVQDDDDNRLTLVAALRHTSGETIECQWPVALQGPQAMGSAFTYGRRYCLLAMCGAHPAGEDDDAQLAGKDHAKLAKDTVKAPRKATRTSSTRDDPQDVWIEPRPVSDLDRPGAEITEPQIRKLGALMREAGIVERIAALDYVASVIGREVSSRRELTRDEAGEVIDALQHRVAVDLATGELT
jgi:hypothetical protein